MFGSLMEKLWGPKRFLTFYLICGLVAGLSQMGSYAYTYWSVDHSILSPDEFIMYQNMLLGNVTVGASGAIMGILVAYGYTFPNTQLFIMPIPFPIKAKWAITGIIVMDIIGGLTNSASDNIAHFAHLGGALAGLLIVLFWNRNNRQQFF
jgi:membrane associated rhomboid family serine protease